MDKTAFLKIQNITKQFGGLSALNDIYIDIEEDKITSIIGTNGAGKSTLFNIITGMFPPTSGSIIFRGADITARSPNYIVNQGIARSFQITNLFAGLSVYENIRVASQSKAGKLGLFRMVNTLRNVHKKADDILEMLDLYDKRESIAGTLSHGDQRKLEVGISLATAPSLLLLDEPAAGLTAFETEQFIKLIQNISRHVTVVFIEHDMNVVMGISDKIVVMNQGNKLVEGVPEEIKTNEDVKRVYFGGEV